MKQDVFDRDAVRIGDAYRKAGAAQIDSAKHYLACGHMLTEKKETLKHGEWLRWLKANESVLGFQKRSGQKMMDAASKCAVDYAFDEAGAIEFSRQMWDNDTQTANYRSSADDRWETPQDLFDELHREFRFQLDVCANSATAKCKRFFTKQHDGLAQEWTGVCWMNPPYGSTIDKWVEKARTSAEAGAVVVALVPARTDTEWWWNNCLHAEIRFLKGRLRFGGSGWNAPFPTAIVIFGRKQSVKWWDRSC